MQNKRIIPCLDCKDGRVVKGTSFVNLRDAGDPVEIAKLYDKEGADEIVILDITATTDNRGTKVDLVKKVAAEISIPFAVGGGIRNIEDFEELIKVGASKVSINSAAILNPGLIKEAAEKFGSEKVVVAIDGKRKEDGSGWTTVRHGGTIDAGLDVVEWAKEVEKLGAGEILLTSMDEDGQKNGYDIEMTKAVAEAVNIPVVASGGAGSMEDILKAFTEAKADAALAASLFHFREINIPELKQYLLENGVPVRI